MTISEMIKEQIKALGGDGIVNIDAQCGCGDNDGWFLCDCCNLEDCEPAKWQSCKECKLNGDCELQSEYGFIGHPNDGCYRKLKTQGECE